MRKGTIVLGLGNPLMSDEGIGCFLIGRLQAGAERFGDVEFADAGTGGMSILHLIADRQKAVFIDCALMGTEPATIRKFTPAQVRTGRKLAYQSLHEADLLRIVELSQELGQCPERIVIFGIEPESVSPGELISESLTARVDEYVAAICEELLG